MIFQKILDIKYPFWNQLTFIAIFLAWFSWNIDTLLFSIHLIGIRER